ncbi:hypothetical protein LTR86_003614 [Recurvomyces mirabilis]|nr:hypothetical protein LTR86_003614 [Recurvomyces mirabilis]
MASRISEDLAATIHRYAEVANMVNRREMTRFIQDVRQRWHPEPLEDWEPPRPEGYTDEGAFNLCVYELAFGGREPHRDGELCEAEFKNEVLLRSTDDLVDLIPKPCTDPAPQSEVQERLHTLRGLLQEQLNQPPATDGMAIQLPKDFEELVSLTNGINGAGVPSETAYTELIRPLDQHYTNADMLKRISRWVVFRSYALLAAWELGGCVQHRRIYYVLCHKTSTEQPALASWRVFDQDDVSVDTYESLAVFLQHETNFVEERPGGAKQKHVIQDLNYPI